MLAQEALIRWEDDDGQTVLRGWMSPQCGRNGKPVIHFLHGTGLSNLTYWPFLQRFLPEYDLFLNSVEGHGDSDYAARDVYRDWQALTERSLRAFEQQRKDWDNVPVIGLAHSFGAVATVLMHPIISRPFDQYVLLDPVIYPKSLVALMRVLGVLGLNRQLPHVKQASKRRSGWSDRAAVKASFQGRGVFKSWADEALDSYIDHAVAPDAQGQWQLRCPPWLEARIFAGCPKGLWRAIAELPPHTAIIHSVNTYAFVPPAVRKAEQANPHISLTSVEGGHCFMLETPTSSYQAVRALMVF